MVDGGTGRRSRDGWENRAQDKYIEVPSRLDGTTSMIMDEDTSKIERKCADVVWNFWSMDKFSVRLDSPPNFLKLDKCIKQHCS